MKIERAFWDVNFFIRLLNSDDAYLEHAKDYFKRMLKDEIGWYSGANQDRVIRSIMVSNGNTNQGS